MSRLARASWIEISQGTISAKEARRGSQEPRGSKLAEVAELKENGLSRLARASWIEINMFCRIRFTRAVEARKSLVDRNYIIHHSFKTFFVEARKSLVDRNCLAEACGRNEIVEARKSLVDRNVKIRKAFVPPGSRGSQEPRGSKSKRYVSPSTVVWSRLARASWIEISTAGALLFLFSVEARKSLVDRNSTLDSHQGIAVIVEARKSLVDRNDSFHSLISSSSMSRLARASWIEIK